jgi:hypothetical protein
VQDTATLPYHLLKDRGNTTQWLFTIPDMPENERAVEEHDPEAMLSAITTLQITIAMVSFSEPSLEAASVMSEVAYPWTICR